MPQSARTIAASRTVESTRPRSATGDAARSTSALCAAPAIATPPATCHRAQACRRADRADSMIAAPTQTTSTASRRGAQSVTVRTTSGRRGRRPIRGCADECTARSPSRDGLRSDDRHDQQGRHRAVGEESEGADPCGRVDGQEVDGGSRDGHQAVDAEHGAQPAAAGIAGQPCDEYRKHRRHRPRCHGEEGHDERHVLQRDGAPRVDASCDQEGHRKGADGHVADDASRRHAVRHKPQRLRCAAQRSHGDAPLIFRAGRVTSSLVRVALLCYPQTALRVTLT